MVRCLYEVLEVERDADDSAIRLAYRKAALKWHPDKNQHQAEEAGDRFKEIQNAYEVLSDKHERSWYDSHREAILRSGDRHQAGASSMAGGEEPPDDINLYSYFSSTAYSGFGDGTRGFYAVYAGLFQKLATQETESRKGGERSRFVYPTFGSSSSSWAEVSAFYSEWSGFSTSRSFSWADQYNPATAPNRQVRRMIEAENEKARRAGRREFNENVREMVAFVKKRDKRVLAHAVEEAARRAEAAALEAERREKEKQERLARAQQYKEAAWLAASTADDSGSEEELLEEELLTWYCMACEKHFKSDRAYQNHQNSKKHKEQVSLLRAVMEEDELALLEENSADESGAGGPSSTVSGSQAGLRPVPAEASPLADSSAHSASDPHSDAVGSDVDAASSNTSDSETSGSDDSASSGEESSVSTTGGVDRDGTSSSEESSDDDRHDNGDDDDDDAAMLERMLEAQRKIPRRRKQQQRAAEAKTTAQLERMAVKDSGDEAGVAGGVEEVSEPQTSPSSTPPSGLGLATADSAAEEAPLQARGKQAARQRRRAAKEERAAAPLAPPPLAPTHAASRKGKAKKRGGAAAETEDLSCQICSKSFSSRTQLFKHIAVTGHAALRS